MFTLCWSILYYFVWMNAVLNQFACYCLAFFQHLLLLCCYLLSTISTFYIKKYWSHIVQCSSLSLEPTYHLLLSTPSYHSPSFSLHSPYVIFVIFILSLSLFMTLSFAFYAQDLFLKSFPPLTVSVLVLFRSCFGPCTNSFLFLGYFSLIFCFGHLW